MKSTRLISVGIVCVSVGLVNVDTGFGDERAATESNNTQDDQIQSVGAKSDEEEGISLKVARERTKVMHDIYGATLDVMHHRYFHGERAIVPARAMEDIFSTVKQQSKVEARWISVNMKPMSISHEPKSDFEKRAAKEIAAGKTDYDVVEGGYYRHARAIPLSNSCISCHDGFFKGPSKTPKFAGLVISVPLRKQ